MLVSMVLAFMATVTCYLLAMVFALATDGAAREIEVLVYGIASAFGLEFLWTCLLYTSPSPRDRS